MSDIVDFPQREKEPFLIGPFEHYDVIVEGRRIPHLTGFPQSDGRVTLIVDGRFMVDFPTEELARQAAWLIAQALAVGAGYTHLGATDKNAAPFAPQVAGLSLEPRG